MPSRGVQVSLMQNLCVLCVFVCVFNKRDRECMYSSLFFEVNIKSSEMNVLYRCRVTEFTPLSSATVPPIRPTRRTPVDGSPGRGGAQHFCYADKYSQWGHVSHLRMPLEVLRK